MAGESPDRSKQRESSAEPTSGSASPVPEKRDPRWAVSREAEPSEGRGNVDTATRVLSARDGAPAGEGAESGRLREAVAAWVRSADPDESGTGSEGATADTEDASDAGTAAAGEREDASDAGTAEGATEDDASGDQDGPGVQPESGDADDARDDAEDASGRTAAATKPKGEAEDGPETPAATEDASEAGTAEGATEDDASGDQDGPGVQPESGDADDARDDAEDASGRTAAATKPKGEAEDGPETPAATEDASEAGTAEGVTVDDASGDQDGPGNASRATTGTGTDTDAPETTDDTSRDRGRPGSAGEDTAAADVSRAEEAPEGAGAGADASESGVFAGDASRDRDVPEGGAADGTAESDALAGAGSDDEPAGDAPEAGTGRDGRPKAKGPVDQPTAVFRTGRPSAPAVDQPTTMLKLGGAGREAEVEAERTSKFVALKRDDDLGVRKPPAAPTAPAGATTSLPQVGPERTTQQPLPPRPPLDLLAELTNTPPPPQTPLRTAVRRVKIWTPLVLLLVIVFAVVQNVRSLPAPTLVLTAEESYTFEGDKLDLPWPAKGQAALDVDGIGTFGSSGEQKPVPIASVAKVMTAYLVLRDHPLKSGAEGPMIKVDELAEKQSDAGQESTVNVTAGDEISQREAIEAILIASANNVARLLARWDAGSEKAFVQKMNTAAKDLGMTDTTYTDPSGLNDTTVSTAVDQVKLAKAAMKQPAFREVAAMMEYIDYKNVKHGNWNRLVGHNDVVGIKTGTTTSALGNLTFAAKKDVDGETHRIIGAVVRQPEGGSDNTILGGALAAGDQLIRAAQDVLESATILKKGTVVGYADDGLGGRTPVAVTEDVKAVGWAGLSVKLTFAGEELPHTAKAGTEVGTLTVGDGTSGAVKVPVALQEDLVEPGFTDKLTRLT
ncbi:D-alanyl-D-alanine carboxypeptidase [Streptomyces sp. NPDC020731]|uniref:D-alanyl-D-alanine carboxypeptidase n=1 Tax=Streptomyces sp. NPDC020731 TaxID=3365085 RepID=UPI0037908192